MNEIDRASAETFEGLPFDLRTVLISVLRRRRFLISFAVGSVIVALIIALIFGAPVYQAQSVLMYHPDSDGRINDPALTVQTQANMVVLESNLEEARRRVGLEATLKELEAACEAKTQPNTALLMIDVLWKSPEVAAQLANALRDVFVANQMKVRQSSAALEVQDLRARIEQLRARLKGIDARLGEFSSTHGLVDLDKETQNYLAEEGQIELLSAQARAEKQSIEMQLSNSERLLRSAGASKGEGLGDLNMHYARLRDAIHEDQSIRSNLEKLELDKIEMERTKQLYQEGLLPKNEYDKAELAYRAQKEVALDTDQVKAWRAEISKIDEGLIPAGGAAVSSKETMQKLFQLQLDRIAAEEKAKALDQAAARIREKIASLPKLQRDYLAFARESESSETELKLLQEKLGRAERAQMAKSSEFATIADATPPAFPTKSWRRIIFFAIAAFGAFLGLGLVLARELLNNTVRSPGEAALKVPVPVLGVIPRVWEGTPEAFRALTLHLKRRIPKPDARILVTSARYGEGVDKVVGGVGGMALVEGPPILESVESEVLAASCEAVLLVIASGVTPVSDINEAISRIKSTGVPLAGAVLNQVDPAYL